MTSINLNIFEDFLQITKNNHDDFVWILFEKSCGYSFIFPFLKNSNTFVLYNHLDCLWNTTVNHIWNQYREYLPRESGLKIRDWILKSNMTSLTSIGYPIVYKVYFNTGSVPNNNNTCCNNNNSNQN